MSAGVYEIKNQLTSERYIGSSCNVYFRFSQHLRELRAGRSNRKLQNAFIKYGEAAFEFSILEVVNCANRVKLFRREQKWMDRLKPEYNMRLVAAGIEMTAEVRAKLSLSHKGRLLGAQSERHRARIATALKGNKNGEGRAECRHSEETRRKLSEARLRAERFQTSVGRSEFFTS